MEKFKNYYGYEPKSKNRFVVKLPKILDIECYYVRLCSAPIYDIEEGWENIKLIFNDPVNPSTTEKLLNFIGFLTENKDLESKSLFSFEVEILDPTGTVVETWLIDVKEVIKINFGEFDYENDDVRKPFMILKPNYCTIIKDN